MVRKLKPLQVAGRRAGTSGFSAATIIHYGPNRSFASKIVVCLVDPKRGTTGEMRKWFGDVLDVRKDQRIANEVTEFLKAAGVRKVVTTPGIFGCPHEEGIDYPRGTECPQCPYWHGRDRYNFEPD